LSFWLASSITGNKIGKFVPTSDFEGYYMYLPATFVYGGFEHIPVNTPHEYKTFKNTNKIGDRFTCGVALMMLPFYALAMLLRLLQGASLDVYYSIGIAKSLYIAGCFYGILGLYFVNGILKNRNITRNVRLLTIGILYVGTNLMYYTVKEPLMSHAYSFCTIAAFLYYLPNFLVTPTLKNTLRIGLISGLIILIRPTNIFLMSLYFFYDVDSRNALKSRFTLLKNNWHFALLIFVEIVVIFSPQMLYWYDLSGKFFINAYQEMHNQHFDFTNPHFWQVFFHPCNGFFIYNPVMVLSIIGLMLSIKNKVKNSKLLFTLFIFHAYVCASWCMWWFGHSYGYRPFIDFYPFLALGLATCIDLIVNLKNNLIKYAAFTLILCLVFINLRLIIYAPYLQVEPDMNNINTLYNALNWAIDLRKW
jgi:hypothetical protein